jgi:hypothetical protein
MGIGEWVPVLPDMFPDAPHISGSDECVNPSAFAEFKIGGTNVNFDVCSVWSRYKPWLAWFLYALTFVFIAKRVRSVVTT